MIKLPAEFTKVSYKVNENAAILLIRKGGTHLVLLRHLFVLEENVSRRINVRTGIERPIAQAVVTTHENPCLDKSKKDISQILSLVILDHREVLGGLRSPSTR